VWYHLADIHQGQKTMIAVIEVHVQAVVITGLASPSRLISAMVHFFSFVVVLELCGVGHKFVRDGRWITQAQCILTYAYKSSGGRSMFHYFGGQQMRRDRNNESRPIECRAGRSVRSHNGSPHSHLAVRRKLVTNPTVSSYLIDT
jgi:hypothetical protein